MKRAMYLLLVTMSLATFNAYAECNAQYKTCTGKITYLSQWPSGLLVQLDNHVGAINPAKCGNTGYYMVSNVSANTNTANDGISNINDANKFMKAMLLAAKLNDETVTIYISGNACLDGLRPQIASVRVL